MKIIFLSFIFYASLHAQVCDTNLKPVQDDVLGYQPREMRCEGFYESKVAAPDFIEIMNFTKGKLDYNLSITDTIKITPQAGQDQVIRLRAKALPFHTYYRMDALIDSNAVLLWPVGDVLYKSEMSSDMIGVIGWFEDQNKVKTYVPLRAESYEKPGSDLESFYIVLRPTIDLDRIFYSVYSFQDSSDTGHRRVSNFPTPAGGLIRIFPKLEKVGLYRLDLAFKIGNDQNDDWNYKQVFILR